MAVKTPQMQMWLEDFGREYTHRNTRSNEEMNRVFKEKVGASRAEMNTEFLDGLDRSIRILEVGCNIGLQLEAVQAMGFTNLYGVEIQARAVEAAKQRTTGINIIEGSGFDVPFKDGFFDLVFTSTVLIHIAPDDLPRLMAEIHRCTNRYIWGYEFWSAEPCQVVYRGQKDLLWKDDFPRVYMRQFGDLELVEEKNYKHTAADLEDIMFLLQKRQAG